jgi:hypothetical protein
MRSLQPSNNDEWPTIPELSPPPPTPREKKPRLPTIDEEAGTRFSDEGFARSLAAMASDIRQAARGRTCGDCRHLRDGWCASRLNMDGDSLRVLSPYAVACGSFEARP